MKITHLTPDPKPATIIVRHYDKSITQYWDSMVMNFKDAEPFEIAQFRIKYVNVVPKEYNHLK
jgi:hypothetical protein